MSADGTSDDELFASLARAGGEQVRPGFADASPPSLWSSSDDDDDNARPLGNTGRPRAVTVGSFIIGDKLGEGAYAVVREAINRDTLRIVAVKIVDLRRLRRVRGGVENIGREVRVQKSLKRHPNLIELVHFEEDHNKQKAYLFMEISNGCTVQQLIEIAPGRRLPETQVANLLFQTLTGLQYMHGRGIVHRDIKPGNLLVSAEGELKIADFGVAEPLNAYALDDSVTRTSGSPAFQAPEIATGEKEYSGTKVDVWAVGVTAYNMLSGDVPFTASNLVELFRLISEGKYEPLHNVSRLAWGAICLMLDMDWHSRASVEDLLQHPWIREGRRAPPQEEREMLGWVSVPQKKFSILDHVQRLVDNGQMDVLPSRGSKFTSAVSSANAGGDEMRRGPVFDYNRPSAGSASGSVRGSKMSFGAARLSEATASGTFPATSATPAKDPALTALATPAGSSRSAVPRASTSFSAPAVLADSASSGVLADSASSSNLSESSFSTTSFPQPGIPTFLNARAQTSEPLYAKVPASHNPPMRVSSAIPGSLSKDTAPPARAAQSVASGQRAPVVVVAKRTSARPSSVEDEENPLTSRLALADSAVATTYVPSRDELAVPAHRGLYEGGSARVIPAKPADVLSVAGATSPTSLNESAAIATTAAPGTAEAPFVTSREFDASSQHWHKGYVTGNAGMGRNYSDDGGTAVDASSVFSASGVITSGGAPEPDAEASRVSIPLTLPETTDPTSGWSTGTPHGVLYAAARVGTGSQMEVADFNEDDASFPRQSPVSPATSETTEAQGIRHMQRVEHEAFSGGLQCTAAGGPTTELVSTDEATRHWPGDADASPRERTPTIAREGKSTVRSPPVSEMPEGDTSDVEHAESAGVVPSCAASLESEPRIAPSQRISSRSDGLTRFSERSRGCTIT